MPFLSCNLLTSSKSSNFNLILLKTVDFAHALGKVYVTTNIIPHHEDLDGLIEYLKDLERVKVDAVIAASPVIIKTALDNTNLEVHLSTQQSAINFEALKFWKTTELKNVLDELSLDEINLLPKGEVDLEVFIHGGMCMSFSGRCSLSIT